MSAKMIDFQEMYLKKSVAAICKQREINDPVAQTVILEIVKEIHKGLIEYNAHIQKIIEDMLSVQNVPPMVIKNES